MMRPITKEACINEDKSLVGGQSSLINLTVLIDTQSTNSGRSGYVCQL